MQNNMTVVLLAVLFSFVFIVPAEAADVPIGKGCTTAFYIDKDCDGYGVGKKSDGNYILGFNGEALGKPLIESAGNMPDADDEDASVHSTAQWQAKWGNGNSAIIDFLRERKAFTNTSRVYYLAPDGNDTTGVVNDPARPYRTMAPILTIMRDLQGGAIIIRGANRTDVDFRPCGSNNPCYALSGSAEKPVYVLAYPGEIVKLSAQSAIIGNDLNYWPQKNTRYVSYDGLILAAANYGLGDGVSLFDTDHMTIINSEFLGWHQLFWGNHSEDQLVEGNVFHQMMYHTVYFGSYGLAVQGPGDFDFEADAAAYAAGTSVGADKNIIVRSNVMYNNGDSGYEPIHINTMVKNAVVEGNIVSYSGGAAVGFQTGVYNSQIRNNAFFDNGACAITFWLYGTAYAQSLRWNTIENNTIYVGNIGESIRNRKPACAFSASIESVVDPTQHWIKDTLIQNNAIVTWNQSAGYGSYFALLGRGSYPDTFTIRNNMIWNSTGTPSINDRAMVIRSDAFPDGRWAGTYNFTQMQALSAGFTGNHYADPMLVSASPTYTLTPGLFDFHLQAGSPAIGAGYGNGLTTDIQGNSRIPLPDIGAYQHSSGDADTTAPGAPTGIIVF